MNLGKRYMEFCLFGCAGSSSLHGPSLLHGPSSSLGERELLFMEVLGLLIAVAPLVSGHRVLVLQ